MSDFSVDHAPYLYIFDQAGIFIAAAIVTFILYRPPVRELQTSLTTKEKLSRVCGQAPEGNNCETNVTVSSSIGLAMALRSLLLCYS